MSDEGEPAITNMKSTKRHLPRSWSDVSSSTSLLRDDARTERDMDFPLLTSSLSNIMLFSGSYIRKRGKIRVISKVEYACVKDQL